MSEKSPTPAEAFMELAAGFARLRAIWKCVGRYLAADMHRARLVQSGQYIKTSSRKARP